MSLNLQVNNIDDKNLEISFNRQTIMPILTFAHSKYK